MWYGTTDGYIVSSQLPSAAGCLQTAPVYTTPYKGEEVVTGATMLYTTVRKATHTPHPQQLRVQSRGERKPSMCLVWPPTPNNHEAKKGTQGPYFSLQRHNRNLLSGRSGQHSGWGRHQDNFDERSMTSEGSEPHNSQESDRLTQTGRTGRKHLYNRKSRVVHRANVETDESGEQNRTETTARRDRDDYSALAGSHRITGGPDCPHTASGELGGCRERVPASSK
ncbi:hypothetical protein E2C01_047198 [Portunus trituberculatus]|uniref:Uncharacterized protein n=1 Tax=Portunus trituberculatus TaxID=210409 RepID=A0A5B7G6T5_PORTR|nr:hypothetical protein [Portunus trituberculatus]